MLDKNSNDSLKSVQTTNAPNSKPFDGSDFGEADLKRAEKELTQRVVGMQRAIQRVDLLAATCAFVTIALALWLFGIVLDCWILSDGLTEKGRLYYAIFWGVATVLFFISRLVPVFRRRVNALYAAKILEDVWQDKHNLTINWLQLCKLAQVDSQNAELPLEANARRIAVLRQVALQATANAKKQPAETPVDCSSLIRWGIAFAVVVAVCAGYVVLSSKDPFTGAFRILAPLAEVARPQALSFESIEPGDAVAYQGDFIDIKAKIPGAESYDVELLYSSEDGRLTDVSVPLEAQEQEVDVYKTTFPNAEEQEEGLTESLTYRIRVGRGTRRESYSDSFHIEVRPQPSFRVEKTIFEFPEYTGLAKQTFENQGEIRALEGTKVTIVAKCNTDLERAALLPDGSQARAQKMTVDAANPKLASIEIPLTKSAEPSQGQNESGQEFDSYALVSHDVDGQENRERQEYPVSVVADLSPTIDWESAPSEIVEVPLNDVLRIKLVAEDPDFSLRQAQIAFALRNQANNKRNAIKPMDVPLANDKRDYSQGPTPFVGVQRIPCEIKPEELGFSVGDEIEYWGIAYDSKLPEPNSGVTDKKVFRVVEPVDSPHGVEAPDEQQDEPDPEDSKNEDGSGQNGGQEGEGQQSDEQNGSSQNSDSDGKDGQNAKPNPEGESEEPSQASQGENGEESQNGGEQSSEGESSGESGDSESDSGQDGSGEQGEQGDSSNEGAQNEGEQGGQGSDSSQTGEDDSQSGEGKSPSNNSQDQSSDGSSDAGSDQSGDQQPDEQNDAEGDPNGSPQNQSEGTPQSGDSGQSSESNAFETILDYMKEKESDSPQNGDSSEDAEDSQDRSGKEEDEQGSGSASGNDSSEPTDRQGDAAESEEEVDPNFDSQDRLGKPEAKRDLPKRTSPEKPKDDSPVYQANNPDQVDANTKRNQGEVDPNTNDYLAQNADQNTPYSDNPKSKNDANVTLDPTDQTEAVAGDAVKPNAAEAKGNSQSNIPPDAPSEIDQDGKTPEGAPNAPENDRDNTSPSNNGSNDDNPSMPEDPTAQTSGQPSDSGSGDSNSNPDKEQRKGDSPSNGKSDENSTQQGGGGGSGLGEVGGDTQKLAPADSPKLQYAEEATSLVLNYLEDSLKDGIDRELLDKLGWTDEQLRDFLKRWQKLRKNAENGDAKAKSEYLKALGDFEFNDADMPSSSESDFDPRTSSRPDANRRGVSAQEAARLKTPDRLDERVRAFTRGVSNGAH